MYVDPEEDAMSVPEALKSREGWITINTSVRYIFDLTGYRVNPVRVFRVLHEELGVPWDRKRYLLVGRTLTDLMDRLGLVRHFF